VKPFEASGQTVKLDASAKQSITLKVIFAQ
jgi:hypothetical protein